MSVLEAGEGDAAEETDASPDSTTPAVGTQVEIVPDYLKQHYISFGGPTRFVTDSYFLAALGPLGVSREAFANLCHALGVPLLHFGEHRLVDLFSFHLAMRAVCQIGRPDFFVSPDPRGRRSTLATVTIKENYESLVRDMIVARDAAITPEEARRHAEEAAHRLVEFSLCFVASDRQRMHDAKSRKAAQATLDRVNADLSVASVDREFPALPGDPFDLLPPEKLKQITVPPPVSEEESSDQPPA